MLEVKNIPKIEECFESSINPYVKKVHEDTVNWAKINNLMNEVVMLHLDVINQQC